jgi:prefoldin subunit 5
MSSELQQLEQSLQQLSRNSRGSIIMILIGACALVGSLVYSATRLAPLERDIAAKRQQIAGFDQRLAQLSASEAALQQQITDSSARLAELRQNIEQLYAVKVSADNTVFELKATALATGYSAGPRPIYDFAIFVNAPRTTLNSIKQVSYLFDHATFQRRKQITTEPAEQFRVAYKGWGCLTKVTATVLYQSGEQVVIDFNMCKSLGPMWSDNACTDNAEISEKVSKSPPVSKDCVVKPVG